MLEEIFIENSNSLAFLDRNQIVNNLSILKKYPDVVMLSSWDHGASNYENLRLLIDKLLDEGCKCFVCVGKHSESLQDFIDDALLNQTQKGFTPSKRDSGGNLVPGTRSVLGGKGGITRAEKVRKAIKEQEERQKARDALNELLEPN